MKRFAALGVLAMIAACDGPAEFAIAPPIGAGGASAQSSSASTSSSSSATSSSSSSSGVVPMCLDGGAPCATFSECCSGTCANNVCTACGEQGDSCGDGCCVGLTCYSNKCSACGNDGAPCLSPSDCCSTVCANGTCVALDCATQQSCGTFCASLDSDPANCGACSKACAPMRQCCSGVCADTSADSTNCGACGVICQASDDCKGGVCSLSTCCEVGVGIGPGANPGTYFSKYIAWPYTPDCSMLVTAIEVYTTRGWIYIMSDGPTGPNAVLAMTGIGVTALPDWKTVDIFPPVQLTATTPYWLVHLGDGQTSISASIGGPALPIKKSTSAAIPPNWPSGPWLDNGTQSIMFKLIGSCAP